MLDRPPRRKRRSTVIDGPDPVDIHVGARVKLRRTLVGLSQMELGGAIGLTFQQVQKYERGSNRISASMLHRIAGALDVPVSFFFDDLPVPTDAPSETRETEIPIPPLGRRETLELLQCYCRLTDPHLRRRVFELIKATIGALQDAIK